MINALPGRRCASLRRFHHRIEGQSASETGPIEFTWDDGTHLTLDANTDWTLDFSGQQWSDPYAHASASQRLEIAKEVGVWEQGSIPADLNRLIGQVVIEAVQEFNEVGEVTGMTVVFNDQCVSVRVVGGELAVEVGR